MCFPYPAEKNTVKSRRKNRRYHSRPEVAAQQTDNTGNTSACYQYELG